MCERGVEPNHEAHHKHIYVVDFTIGCLPKSVVAGQLGMIQMNRV